MRGPELKASGGRLGVLGGHPGQAPLEVGQHVLHSLGPLLFAVELNLDGVGVAGGRVLDLALLHLVGQTEAGVAPLHLLLQRNQQRSVKKMVQIH